MTEKGGGGITSAGGKVRKKQKEQITLKGKKHFSTGREKA